MQELSNMQFLVLLMSCVMSCKYQIYDIRFCFGCQILVVLQVENFNKYLTFDVYIHSNINPSRYTRIGGEGINPCIHMK